MKIIAVKIEETHLATFLAIDGGKKRERGSRKLGEAGIYSHKRWGYILTRDNMHKSQNIHILQE